MASGINLFTCDRAPEQSISAVMANSCRRPAADLQRWRPPPAATVRAGRPRTNRRTQVTRIRSARLAARGRWGRGTESPAPESRKQQARLKGKPERPPGLLEFACECVVAATIRMAITMIGEIVPGRSLQPASPAARPHCNNTCRHVSARRSGDANSHRRQPGPPGHPRQSIPLVKHLVPTHTSARPTAKLSTASVHPVRWYPRRTQRQPFDFRSSCRSPAVPRRIFEGKWSRARLQRALVPGDAAP